MCVVCGGLGLLVKMGVDIPGRCAVQPGRVAVGGLDGLAAPPDGPDPRLKNANRKSHHIGLRSTKPAPDKCGHPRA